VQGISNTTIKKRIMNISVAGKTCSMPYYMDAKHSRLWSDIVDKRSGFSPVTNSTDVRNHICWFNPVLINAFLR
jgi:hypothetical protein